MRTKRTQNKSHKNRRTKKGGFWWLINQNKQQNYNKITPSECDPNQLTKLRTQDELHSQYQKCCPKTWYGTKNSSPYCKQIDLNFQGLRTGQNNANEYYGYSPEEIQNMKNSPSYYSGGKRTRRGKSNKNKSRKTSRK